MNSGNTAISRKTASRPTKDLFERGAIWGRVLDYGCGKGKDTEFLRTKHFVTEKFDKHYHPVAPVGKFDTIICNYVLNVIEDERDRVQLIKNVIRLLHVGGKAYFTARCDVDTAAKKAGWPEYKDGYVTGKNTFQLNITDEYINELYSMAKIIFPTVKLTSFKSSAKYTILAIQRRKFYPEAQ